MADDDVFNVVPGSKLTLDRVNRFRCRIVRNGAPIGVVRWAWGRWRRVDAATEGDGWLDLLEAATAIHRATPMPGHATQAAESSALG